MKLLRRLAWWLRHRQHEAELAEELALHEALKQEELARAGMTPSGAGRARQRSMGNTTRMREAAREVWIWSWLQDLVQDVRFAFRSARRSPSFTLGVVAIMALGIGVTTTIFSVVDGVLLRRLPYPASERLITFDQGAHSPPKFADWQEAITSVDRWAAAFDSDEDLNGTGHPERISAAHVTPEFFPLFGARAAAGRLFTSGDFTGEGSVVVLGAGFWRRRFGGDSAILGRTIQISGRSVTVAGVIGTEFVEPEGVVRRPTDVWFPLDLTLPKYQDRRFQILNVVGRLRAGVPLATAQQELPLVAARLAAANPEVHGDGEGGALPIVAVALRQAIVREVDLGLYTLLAAVGLMLLIGCANVSNLYLARSTERFREIALRTALGARRGRLVRQLITESVTLGLLAGILGAVLARVGVRALMSIYPGALPRGGEVQVDLRALAFAIGMSLLTGLVFGLFPSWALAEPRVHAAIKAGAPIGGHRRGGIRAALVITEVALALVLLIGSGLLFNSFLHIVGVDPGFQPDQVVVAQLILGDNFTDAQRLAFARDVEERVRALPGVTDAGVGVISPMTWFGSQRCCWNSRGITRDDGTILDRRALLQPIGPRYFETLGARLRGTGFLAGETYAEPYPVIISDALARQLYGEAEPIGHSFTLDDRKYQVRGVVSGLHQWGLDQAAEAEIYLPYARFGGMFDRLSILARTTGDPVALIPQVREAIWEVQPSLPADDVGLLGDQVSHTLAEPRFYSTLMGVFGLLALTLAAVGIYASMLYSVRQRTRELGIRLALGARRQDILSMIVWEAGRLGLVGLVLGALSAAALTRLLSAFLFGVTPGDPFTFLLAVAILGATILAAAWLPALRASRADGLTILRSD